MGAGWPALAAVLGLTLSLASGCARGAVAREESFRELQVHEASLAHAQRALDSCAGESAESVCVQARALCAVAEGLHDADATRRCQRAGDSCRAARGHAASDCATQAP